MINIQNLIKLFTIFMHIEILYLSNFLCLKFFLLSITKLNLKIMAKVENILIPAKFISIMFHLVVVTMVFFSYVEI